MVLALAIGAGVFYVNSLFDDIIVTEEEEENPVDTMVNQKLEEKTDNVENYALFGLDCRTDGYEGCRSDVMMIVSYNKDTNNVTLASVPRDTYVEITGHGFDKINHAYAFGGPTLALQTLNRAFDLDIKQYVSVNFSAVEKIIDAIGGVEVMIDSYEIGHVPGIYQAGLQHLNGAQALAYSRIRYVGNGDFERMERQREVIGSALEVISTSNVTTLMSLVNELLPLVRTNIVQKEMLTLVTGLMTNGIPALSTTQVPAQADGVGTTLGGIYYFVPKSLEEAAISLHELIHPTTKYEVSDTLKAMSDALRAVIY